MQSMEQIIPYVRGSARDRVMSVLARSPDGIRHGDLLRRVSPTSSTELKGIIDALRNDGLVGVEIAPTATKPSVRYIAK